MRKENGSIPDFKMSSLYATCLVKGMEWFHFYFVKGTRMELPTITWGTHFGNSFPSSFLPLAAQAPSAMAPPPLCHPPHVGLSLSRCRVALPRRAPRAPTRTEWAPPVLRPLRRSKILLAPNRAPMPCKIRPALPGLQPHVVQAPSCATSLSPAPHQQNYAR